MTFPAPTGGGVLLADFESPFASLDSGCAAACFLAKAYLILEENDFLVSVINDSLCFELYTYYSIIFHIGPNDTNYLPSDTSDAVKVLTTLALPRSST